MNNSASIHFFSRPHIRPTVFAIAIFVITFLLFSPSLHYELVHIDDIVYISNNTSIHDGLSVFGLREAVSPANTTATMYMPLLWISYMLDIEWLHASPENPWGFHFTNVILHSLNAALLYLLLQIIFRNFWLAFFFAALWAWHPLRVESVAWISGRKDVLSGCFALLCVIAHLLAGRRQGCLRSSIPLMGSSLLWFVLGVLTKPALVPLPLVLLLLDLWPLKRLSFSPWTWPRTLPRLLAEKTPFFLVATLTGIGTMATHHIVSGEIPASLTSRLQSIPLSYGFYLLKTVFPQNLTVLYPHWPTWLTASQAWGFGITATLLVAGLTAAAWRGRAWVPGAWVGWLWFLLMLFPVSGIVPIPTNDVADRFSYMPAIGISIALCALAMRHTFCAGFARWATVSVATLLLATLAGLSVRQLPVWQTADSLNSRVLTVFPRHATALEIKAGNLMRSSGNFAEASRLLSVALEADPFHWKSLMAQAHCLWALEGAEAALDLLENAYPPTSRNTLSEWHRDLARYTLMLGHYEKALHHSETSIALLPPHDLSRIPVLMLAMTAAYKDGNQSRALYYAHQFPPYANKAELALPDLLPHYVFQWVAGYRRDTVDYFRKLIEAYPERVDYLNNFVWGLATADWSPVDPDEVLLLAQQLEARVATPHPGILDTLAAAYANAGEFETAAQFIQDAQALLPVRSHDPNVIAFHARLAHRLQHYQQEQPYRESAFTRLFAATIGATAPDPEKKH